MPFPSNATIENPAVVLTEPEYDFEVPDPPVVPEIDVPAFQLQLANVPDELFASPFVPTVNPFVSKEVIFCASVVSASEEFDFNILVAPLTESCKCHAVALSRRFTQTMSGCIFSDSV